jgi:tellurite resistance protein
MLKAVLVCSQRIGRSTGLTTKLLSSKLLWEKGETAVGVGKLMMQVVMMTGCRVQVWNTWYRPTWLRKGMTYMKTGQRLKHSDRCGVHYAPTTMILPTACKRHETMRILTSVSSGTDAA